MGIEIANAESVPAITYNKVHMTKLEIVQPVSNDDNSVPSIQLQLHYRHYGVVDGVRYFKNEDVQRVTIDDFVALATADAVAGDMTLINALKGIESAVAGIIADQTNSQAIVV